MMPFHSLLPEIAQREVRCVHVGPSSTPTQTLPADEYCYLEFYCEDLGCDCRRVFLQVVAKSEPGKTLASINYGWESEAFYRKRMPWDPKAPGEIVRGSLDPINSQSKYSAEFLALFQRVVLDESYRLRLREHYRLFRSTLAARGRHAGGG